MGKDFLSPKQIANRIKAKGLQKLKWYCQMCEKQCRDANGFKCHIQSEAHQRQMAVFSANPKKFTGQFSYQFKRDFVDLLRTRFCNSKVLANRVYNEYISDKSHVHMNGTCWSSLAGFVRTLGREGIAEVEETEKGWYIKYVPRDDERARREEERKKQELSDLDAEQRLLSVLERQRERQAEALAIYAANPTEENLNNIAISDEEYNISFQLKKLNLGEEAVEEANVFEEYDQQDDGDEDIKMQKASRKRSNLDILIDEEERRLERSNKRRKETDQPSQPEPVKLEPPVPVPLPTSVSQIPPPIWLQKNIVVKVMHNTLENGQYYKKKGVVKKIDGTSAVLKMIDSDALLLLDQQYLETVIPQIGGQVRILVGDHAGERAILEKVNIDQFCATLRLKSGGQIVEGVPYENFSKHYSKRSK